MMTFVMHGWACDRCGVQAECRPFTLAESITYRGHRIEKPWLCRRCFVLEKEKWWRA